MHNFHIALVHGVENDIVIVGLLLGRMKLSQINMSSYNKLIVLGLEDEVVSAPIDYLTGPTLDGGHTY